MKRIAIGCAALVCAMFAGGSAAILGQTRTDPNDHPPGLMSQGRMFILNKGASEAIPVAIQGVGEPMKVTGVVDTRAARQVWEYRQLNIPAGQDAIGTLNAAGQDGWEVIGNAQLGPGALVMLLKRPR